jgi:hypothetical protein
MKRGEAHFFEKSVVIYQSTWLYIPENLNLQQHHYENFKSYSEYLVYILF